MTKGDKEKLRESFIKMIGECQKKMDATEDEGTKIAFRFIIEDCYKALRTLDDD